MCGTSGSPRETPKYELLHGMQVTERRIGDGAGYVSYGFAEADLCALIDGRKVVDARPFSRGAVMYVYVAVCVLPNSSVAIL